MRLLFAVALMLLAAVSFAQNAMPLAGTLDVTFVDANGNPIPGATVHYTYVVSGTWDKPDTPTTGTATTDSAGRFTASITADARQTIPFKINLTYQGTQVYYNEEDTWLDFANKPRTLVVQIGALEVVVKDQKGRPVAGAGLLISDGGSQTEAVTDENGVYSFAGGVAGREYTVTARYGASAGHGAASPPASLEIEVPAYDVVVRSVDDLGNRIEAGLTANVTALGKVFRGSGELALTQMPAGEMAVSARYGRARQEVSILVQRDKTEEIVFDLNPPAISDERTEPAQPGEEAVQVVAKVSDAKGVGVANVVLVYTVDGGQEQTVAMVPSGGSYVATIPRQPAGSLVEYYVVATDSNDNRNEGAVKTYEVRAAGEARPDGGAGGGGAGGWGITTDLMIIGGAVVALIILAVVVWRRRE